MVTRAHPHGLVGYVVDDPGRTDRALRLLRWAAAIAVLMVAAVVGVVLTLGASVGVATVGAIAAGIWTRRRGRRVRRSAA
ncbi:Flp pilus assembly protein TadB [Actinokineospora baliensis]|nr:Flp pilus assembly protein TadB [Actinokineospora baliensis]